MIHEPCVILKPDMCQIAESARVDSFVKIEGGQGVIIGECVHICSFCHVNGGGGRVILGDHVGLASGAKVLGGSNTEGGLSMSAASPANIQHVDRSTTTQIDDFAFLGTNSVVLPGVHVGRGAILAAGGVATKDIPEWQIWGGVPARYIRQRQGTNVKGVDL